MKIVSALAVLLCSPVGLQAQDASTQTCAPRAGLEAVMADRFGETRVSVALDGNSFLIEVWVNNSTGTWSATLTTPDGVACMAAYGTGYETVETIPGVDG